MMRAMPGELWRVATFNVRTARAVDGRHPWPARWRSVVGLIDSLRSDVLGLQEAHAFQLRRILDHRPEFDAVSAGRDDGRSRGEHCAILLRRDRGTLTSVVTRWYSDTPDVPGSRLPRASHPRIATIATFTAASGERIQVANTHLDHQHEDNRLRSVEMLLGWLEPDRPTVIVGDLNVRPGDPVVAHLVDGGFVAGLAPSGEGTHHGFSGRADGPQIDHVLVSPHWEIVDCQVVRTDGPLPSDHWPLVATLRLGPTSM